MGVTIVVQQGNTMQRLVHKFAFIAIALIAVANARPQFVPVAEITHYTTGEIIQVNAENLDINGCLVGPAGERVCPQGSFGAAPNGNAGPVNELGFAVDPAAQTYLKQIEAYKQWELKQQAIAERNAELG